MLPTLCDFAGIPKPDGLHGLSRRAAAEGRTVKDSRIYVVSSNHLTQGAALSEPKPTPAGRMLRSERYKYCVYDTGQHRESLVDLDHDPGEMTNLATDPAYARILNEHRSAILSWSRKTGDKKFPYIEPRSGK